jgi:hypothetical protein
MELNFTLITPKANEKTAREAKTREFSNELIGQFVEAWMALLQSPKGSVLSVEFPDAKTRNEWFDDMKAYGLTYDTPVRISRIKGTDSMHPDHGKLTFTMETVDEHTQRINAAKEKVDTTHIREWLKANGHEVSERGRIAAAHMKLYDNRDIVTNTSGNI